MTERGPARIGPRALALTVAPRELPSIQTVSCARHWILILNIDGISSMDRSLRREAAGGLVTQGVALTRRRSQGLNVSFVSAVSSASDRTGAESGRRAGPFVGYRYALF